MITQINSAVLEVLYPHTLRQIERDAERRRIMGELVHKPNPIRRELARLRTYLFLDAVPD
jgi:hypothetical protein